MDNDDFPRPDGTTAAGTVIAERYRLIDRIAGGGMGDVWRAVDEVLGRTVAIKLLRPEYADDEQFRERLRREARAASAINDVGVVPVYDFGEIERDNAPPLSYLVMEHVDGLSLSAEVSTLGPLGAERTLLILEQTASALQAAHEAGVIHRDVKPGNILVTPSGDLKITDFGIARASDTVPLTRTGMMTGTAKYLSPEQARGKEATAASDIYSLGIVAYACLTGDVPFSEGNDVSVALAHVQQEPPALPADIPAGLRELVMSMLAKKPEDRPANATAVAETARMLRRGDPSTIDHPFPAVTPTTQALTHDTNDPTSTLDAMTPGIATDAVAATGSMPAQTAYAPAAESDVELLDEPAFPPEDYDDSDDNGSRRHKIRLAVIALVLALLAAAVYILALSGGTQVPNVVGKDKDQAETLLTSAGLKAKFAPAEDVAGKKAGIVVRQSDEPGIRVDEGTTVTLTVASGKVEVPTDDLLGASYDEAEGILRDLGLRASKQTAVSQEKADTVIGVNPEGRADVGSTVTLTVSAGPVTPTPTTPSESPDETEPTTEPTEEPTTEEPTTEPTEETTDPEEEGG